MLMLVLMLIIVQNSHSANIIKINWPKVEWVFRPQVHISHMIRWQEVKGGPGPTGISINLSEKREIVEEGGNKDEIKNFPHMPIEKLFKFCPVFLSLCNPYKWSCKMNGNFLSQVSSEINWPFVVAKIWAIIVNSVNQAQLIISWLEQLDKSLCTTLSEIL